MLIEQGIVNRLETDTRGQQWAWISIQRKSTCGHCESSGSCGTGALNSYFADRTQALRLPNPGNLAAGQAVRIGIEENALLQASFLVYLLPLLSLFISGALVQSGLPALGEGGVIVAAAAGLALGFFFIRRLPARKTRFQPVILSE